MATRARTAPATAETTGDIVFVREGIFAGLLGAAVIALFFFVVDVANGRPLWTPHALGAALFRDAGATPGEPVSPALIGAYTFVHGYVFVSVGLIGAFLLDWLRPRRERRWVSVLELAVAAFLAFGVLFVSFRWLRGAHAVMPFGLGWVLVTNALAAVAMAAFLVLRVAPRADRAD
jgi:hypothetical protein